MTTTTGAQAGVGDARAHSIRIFDRRGELRDIDHDATPDALLARAKREHGLLWIDFLDPDAEDLAPWAEAYRLHPLAVAEAASGDQQPTVQGFGDQLFLVIWASPDRDRAQADEVPKLFVFLDDHLMLTVQRGAVPTTFELARRLPAETRYLVDGAAGALYVVFAAIAEHYSQLVTAIERELSDLETEVFDEATVDDAGRIYRLRQRLGRLERPVSSLVHSLSRTPDSLTRLIQRHPRLAPYLTDAIDDLMGIGGMVHEQQLAVDTIVASHENNVAQQQNADMRRISAYGALLAVPTVVAGVWGMNFQNIPGTSWDGGWYAIVGIVAALDAVIFVAFKRRRWL